MKKKLGAMAVISLLWLCLGVFSSFAAAGGGAEVRTDGQTEIWAGVVVDYMGKLRFEVKDEATGDPIPGASVELWIPGINGGEGAYVLFGVTDENGVLELDVTRNTRGQESTFETIDGKLTFGGSLLYLSDNHLQYQVYKAGWLPYPQRGEVTLELKEVPQVVVVWLHKKGGNGDGGGPGGGSGDGGRTQVVTEINAEDPPLAVLFPEEVPLAIIPKTGVEDYAWFWGIGCAALLAAAALTAILLWRERRKRKEPD